MKTSREKHFSGKILSPGIAVGKLYAVQESIKIPPQNRVVDAGKEIERFRKLVNRIADDLLKLYESIAQEIDPAEAEIVETQRMLVLDEGFQKKVLNLISAEFFSAEIAAQKVLRNVANQLGNTKNEFFRQRVDDLYDLAKYFLNKEIEKNNLPYTKFKEDTIITVSELFPSTVLSCRNTRVKGILADQGAPTSHAAILSKSLGIPVLLGFTDLTESIRKNQFVILDGIEGKIIVNPETATVSFYEAKLKKLRTASTLAKNISGQPALTADGTPIDIYVNIERPDELDSLPLNDIDGIGLFRTEFLFMFGRTDFPSREQQIEWYRRTISFMQGKPVTIRILDIGGDKFLPYFGMGRQDNPYLGLRGNRVFRFHPELLETQLQAINEAADGRKVRILYPMVNTMEDIDLFKNILSKVSGKRVPDMEIGIMVETPASVFLIRELIREVDFVSIGTNDLVQYTLTVDRNNENVMQHYQPTMPIIIRMLDQVIQTAKEFGKGVSLCGEIASDPLWVPLLIGLGIREFSIAPNAIYPIKQKIRSLNMDGCRALTSRVLKAQYAREVENLLRNFAQDAR